MIRCEIGAEKLGSRICCRSEGLVSHRRLLRVTVGFVGRYILARTAVPGLKVERIVTVVANTMLDLNAEKIDSAHVERQISSRVLVILDDGV